MDKDKQAVPLEQQSCLRYVGDIEEAMVKGMPFEVPKQYANLPQLKVRRLATLPRHASVREELHWQQATGSVRTGRTQVCRVTVKAQQAR
jgi:hypothetical protein